MEQANQLLDDSISDTSDTRAPSSDEDGTNTDDSDTDSSFERSGSSDDDCEMTSIYIDLDP